jgi:hypothetical protein
MTLNLTQINPPKILLLRKKTIPKSQMISRQVILLTIKMTLLSLTHSRIRIIKDEIMPQAK